MTKWSYTAIVKMAARLNAELMQACADRSEVWAENSRLAASYQDDADAVCEALSVEWTKGNEYPTVALSAIRQLQAELAQARAELAAEAALTDARQVTRLWFRRAQKAELAAHVHDKACGELAQTAHTEQQLRREAEQRADDMIADVHSMLNECQVERSYSNGLPAMVPTRIFWLAQRTERAETLAALVTEGMAALLERLGTSWTATLLDDGDCALALAARIREALNDSQA